MISKRHVKQYCCEAANLIENYGKAIADTTQTWVCHHRNEINMKKSTKELIDMGLYYNRPASELIFLTHSEHKSLHGKNMTDECKTKLSAIFKKKWRSEEYKAKMSRPQPKYRWLKPTGEIVIMRKSTVGRCHSDWQLLSNTPVDQNEKV